MNLEITRFSVTSTGRRLMRRCDCLVESSLVLLAGRSKSIILANVREWSCRYSELRRLIPSLSDKTLTQRLRSPISHALVERVPERACLSIGCNG
jgi:DNA-binding HxlR family transcriptional regulator